jgi:hypothetical protein
MPVVADSPALESQRAELQAVLDSPLFARSPSLAHLLSYLCEKSFAGESAQIKEYSVALEVFGRHDSFDQDTDSIVRVQANRLRKRLAEYYAAEGAGHALQISIPVGQYVPSFEAHSAVDTPAVTAAPPAVEAAETSSSSRPRALLLWIVLAALAVTALLIQAGHKTPEVRQAALAPVIRESPEPLVGLPVGDEVRILAGSERGYVDRSGKLWLPDANFQGGTAVRNPVRHIWRTQDPTIYRSSRQGDFRYDLPLKPGAYELRLHFAETYYGPEDAGGGEGSRVMTVSANGRPLLSGLDVFTDAGGGRTADVKVFSDISPAEDGSLHLTFASTKGGRGMVSAIEILPGTPGKMRPVRLVTRDTPYYSDDSRWWGPDAYVKGGQLGTSETPAVADDPELYETERWGRFSYSIPVAAGRYTLTLHFVDRGSANPERNGSSLQPPAAGQRVFQVWCNGREIIGDLDLVAKAGLNRAFVKKISGLEPSAQGKLELDFLPVKGYATVTAIEVVAQ